MISTSLVVMKADTNADVVKKIIDGLLKLASVCLVPASLTIK